MDKISVTKVKPTHLLKDTMNIKSDLILKGGGHGKIYSEFIV